MWYDAKWLCVFWNVNSRRYTSLHIWVINQLRSFGSLIHGDCSIFTSVHCKHHLTWSLNHKGRNTHRYKMGTLSNRFCSVQFRFLPLIRCWISTDKKHQNYLDIQKQKVSLSQCDVTKRESQIQRSQTLLKLERRVLEHRGRLLNAQEEIVEVRKTLNDIRERLHELSG